MKCRAGELNSDELERIVTILQNPTQFKIPTWFLNRQRDIVDGKNSQILSNAVDSKVRDDLERLKKIRAHRGLRHFWGLRVRGQHTKTTGTHIIPCGSFRILTRYSRPPRQDRRCVEKAWLNAFLGEGRTYMALYWLHDIMFFVRLHVSCDHMEYSAARHLYRPSNARFAGSANIMIVSKT